MARARFVAEMPGTCFRFLTQVLKDREQRFQISSRWALLEAIHDHFRGAVKGLSDKERVELLRDYNATLRLVNQLPGGESRLLAAMIDGWWLRADQDGDLCPGCHWAATVHGKAGCEA